MLPSFPLFFSRFRTFRVKTHKQSSKQVGLSSSFVFVFSCSCFHRSRRSSREDGGFHPLFPPSSFPKAISGATNLHVFEYSLCRTPIRQLTPDVGAGAFPPRIPPLLALALFFSLFAHRPNPAVWKKRVLFNPILPYPQTRVVFPQWSFVQHPPSWLHLLFAGWSLITRHPATHLPSDGKMACFSHIFFFFSPV